MPRNLSIALRIAQPIFHGDEQSDEDMRNRSAENIPTMQMQRILYIRANIDYVRRRFAFTGMKRRRFIEMRFFSSSFSPELRSSVFCHANQFKLPSLNIPMFYFLARLQPSINTIM